MNRGDIMEYCEACIECKDSWSAGMDVSCHDACDKFQEWEKERRDCQNKAQFAKSAGMKLTS